MASLIEDYAIIGDCHTVALVGRDGSIDWLCFPRFDSPACFAALLGNQEHGRWLLAPAEEIQAVRRRYRQDTLVLETDYETADGAVTLIDCMPPRTREPDMVRIVVGKRGQVRMRMQLIIRFDYGSIIPWLRRTDKGIRAVAGPDTLILNTDVDLRSENFRTEAEFTVSAGQRVPFVLMWHPSHEPAPAMIDAEETVADSESWWRDWSAPLHLQRPVARGGASFSDHAQGAHLCADGRHRRRANDLAPRTARRRAQLGLSILLVARCDVYFVCVDARRLY